MEPTQLAKAFSFGNFSLCFDNIHEHATWHIPGEQLLKGKSDIIKYCQQVGAYFDTLTTHFTQLQLIENQDSVVITGTAQFVRDGQVVNFVHSCDVYQFNAANEIINITSYCISQKQ